MPSKIVCKASSFLFEDARNFQILFLSLFLGLGILTRDWTLQAGLIITVMLSCLSTQIVLAKLFKLKVFASLPSAVITGLGLSLLLRANEYPTMILAGVVAIASKFLLQVDGKHFFNPANLGIITALVFTGDAWVSPGQWGTDWWYLLVFLGAGGIVLQKVGRWDTSLAFLVVYVLLELGRNFWLGWSFDVWQHQLTSGSLLLFALFMLTDPRSIPNARLGRLIWSGSIAILTFILKDWFYLNTAIFWALFSISPLTVILDNLFVQSRFEWLKPSEC